MALAVAVLAVLVFGGLYLWSCDQERQEREYQDAMRAADEWALSQGVTPETLERWKEHRL